MFVCVSIYVSRHLQRLRMYMHIHPFMHTYIQRMLVKKIEAHLPELSDMSFTCRCTRIHTHIHTTYAGQRLCMYMHIHTYIHTYIQHMQVKKIEAHLSDLAGICSACVCTCIYFHSYIHTYTQRMQVKKIEAHLFELAGISSTAISQKPYAYVKPVGIYVYVCVLVCECECVCVDISSGNICICLCACM